MGREIRAGIVLLAASLLGGCALWPGAQSAPAAPLTHIVMIWLNSPGDAAARERIVVGSEELRQIPGLLSLRVANPVASDRAVVEDSFDLALVMEFADRQAMQDYLTDPRHVEAVKTRFVPVMDRFRVIDLAPAN